MCEHGTLCSRRVCFFAHHSSELRHPTSSIVTRGIKHPKIPAAARPAGSGDSNGVDIKCDTLPAGCPGVDQQSSIPGRSAEQCVATASSPNIGRFGSWPLTLGGSLVQHCSPTGGTLAATQVQEALPGQQRQQSHSQVLMNSVMLLPELGGALSQQQPEQVVVVESLNSSQLAATQYVAQQQQQAWQQQKQHTLSGAYGDSGPPFGPQQQLERAAICSVAGSPARAQCLQQMLLNLGVDEHRPGANAHILGVGWRSSSHGTSPFSSSNAAVSAACHSSVCSYGDLLSMSSVSSVSSVSPIPLALTSAVSSPASELLPGALSSPAAVDSSIEFQLLQDAVYRSSSSTFSSDEPWQQPLLLQHCLHQQEQQQQQLQLQQLLHMSPQAFPPLLADAPASAVAASTHTEQLAHLPPQPPII